MTRELARRANTRTVLHDGFEFDELNGTIAHDFRVVAGFAHVAHARGDEGGVSFTVDHLELTLGNHADVSRGARLEILLLGR